jgi:hypothetical protein
MYIPFITGTAAMMNLPTSGFLATQNRLWAADFMENLMCAVESESRRLPRGLRRVERANPNVLPPKGRRDHPQRTAGEPQSEASASPAKKMTGQELQISMTIEYQPVNIPIVHLFIIGISAGFIPRPLGRMMFMITPCMRRGSSFYHSKFVIRNFYLTIIIFPASSNPPARRRQM